uniref:Transposon Ty3-I Gag-Pol polyprotein n=1 Tax=Cajanus cajan TaxID=3821 RepID=A0A151RFQ1_CAJCA|nr:Transposon Ty3-I Gag-Pol polyprotein [Cajanus cajan]
MGEGFNHKIPLLQGVNPVNKRPYRYVGNQKDIIDKLVQDMLNYGFIQSSCSPYASPVVLVGKKDGSWRLCVDYRELNKGTVKDRFPIPLVEDLMDELNGAMFFSKIDLRSSYHQVRMDPADVHKTVLKTHSGHYERFVRWYGTIARPLTDMLKKDNFVWTNKTKESFQQLKTGLMTALVLALPDFNKTFMVEVDASGYGIGAVKGKENVVADALSRIEHIDCQALTVTSLQSDLLARILQSYQSDPDVQKLISQLQVDANSHKHHSWNGSELRRKGRLVVGRDI